MASIQRHWKLALWAVLATGAAGAGGYYAWQGRDCISGRAAACEKEREALKARSGQVESTLTQVQGNLDTSRQELEALRKWKGDAAKRMQTFRDMSAKLQKMVDGGKLAFAFVMVVWSCAFHRTFSSHQE